MSRADAEDVIEKMAKYDDFFVNLMMNEELGLQVCQCFGNGAVQTPRRSSALYVFVLLP